MSFYQNFRFKSLFYNRYLTLSPFSLSLFWTIAVLSGRGFVVAIELVAILWIAVWVEHRSELVKFVKNANKFHNFLKIKTLIVKLSTCTAISCVWIPTTVRQNGSELRLVVFTFITLIQSVYINLSLTFAGVPVEVKWA